VPLGQFALGFCVDRYDQLAGATESEQFARWLAEATGETRPARLSRAWALAQPSQ